MKKEFITYDLLKEKNVWFELDSEGQPLIYQKDTWSSKKYEGKHYRGWNGGRFRWKELRPQSLTKTSTIYKLVSLKLDDKNAVNQTVQNIVYILSHPEASLKGFDVDHIDNNSLNNNPENLQLLSRKDNNRKKEHQGNQYCNKKNEYKKLK